MKHNKRVKELKKKDKKQTVEDRLGRIEQDVPIIIETLSDLQDRFEELLNRIMDRDEEPVLGGPLHDEAEVEVPFRPIASIEPSGIEGSPYNYLYIYLTDQGPEGPHIIVSDAEEFRAKGICIGMHEHYEGGGKPPIIVHSAKDMIAKIQELMNGTN